MKKSIYSFLLSGLALATGFCAHAQRITVTVAGSGISGYAGDGAPAKMASLSNPYDVCMDAAENIYFSDQTNQRIRKLSAQTGLVTTIAGGGSSAVDGVLAIASSVSASSIAADAAGNIYFTSGAKIRRVDAVTGIITTVAGGGSGDGDGVPAISISLGNTRAICVDASGNVIFAVDNTIRKVNMATGIISTVAGTGAAGYSGDGGPATAAMLKLPLYMAIDPSGNIYFGDQNTGELIRRIDGTTGIITSVIGNGGTLFGCSGLNTRIGGLSGLCCNQDGDVIFNEWSCSCRIWNHTTDWVTNIGGNFSIESFYNDTSSDYAWMNNNYGTCADHENNYYIADVYNNRIRKIIQLTHTPSFAFGQAQSMGVCQGDTRPLDQLLWVADMDVAQTETWTIVTPPSVGTVAGFPATAISGDIRETAKPTDLTYTAPLSFSGTDSFKVRVSDGALSDIITVFIQVAPAPVISGSDAVCLSSSTTMSASIAGGAWTSLTHNALVSSAGLVTGMAAGPDTISYSVNGTCGLYTVTHPINVEVTPVAGVITGWGSVCEGATISLTNDGDDAGIWSVANGSTSVTSAGIVYGVHGGLDTVFYDVSNSCGTYIAMHEVNVDPLPYAGVISGSDTVCLQATATFTNPSSSGSWVLTNLNASINSAGEVIGVTAGADTILYIATNECGIAQTAKPIVIADCAPADFPSVARGESVSIYPNPASALLTISTEGLQGGADISIADITGRGVLHTTMSSKKEINVSSLVHGIYLITLSGPAVHYVDKIVIGR